MLTRSQTETSRGIFCLLGTLIVGLLFVGCGKARVVEQRPGETIKHVFTRCGNRGPCTVIWHNDLVDGPVHYKQRCDKELHETPDGNGVPCIVLDSEIKR